MNVLNEKQRTFAQYYVANGGNGVKAAIEAGYAPGSADNLLANPKVTAVVDFLRVRGAIKFDVTLESLTKNLNEAYTLAYLLGKPNEMVNACKEMARLFNLGAKDSEQSLSINLAAVGEMLDKDLKQRVKQTEDILQ